MMCHNASDTLSDNATGDVITPLMMCHNASDTLSDNATDVW